MTAEQIREIIREELRAFFGNSPVQEPSGVDVFRLREMAAADLAAAHARMAQRKGAKKREVKHAA